MFWNSCRSNSNYNTSKSSFKFNKGFNYNNSNNKMYVTNLILKYFDVYSIFFILFAFRDCSKTKLDNSE